MKAHPQGCFLCYVPDHPYQHDCHTSPTNKADMEANKKAHRLKKRALANSWETKMDVSKDELSKLKDKLAEEIQESKRSCSPKQEKDKDKDKDKKGKGQWEKKSNGANEVRVEEKSATNDAP